MIGMTLGEKVKNARKELNLTQSDVVGNFISRTMLSKIENDMAKPSIETIEYLAKRFNKPISYFLDDNPVVNLTEYPINIVTEKVFEHASYLIKFKEFEKSRKYLLDFVTNHAPSEEDQFYARVLYNLGVVLIELNALDEGLKYLTEASRLLKHSGDFYYLAKTYYKIGFIHYHRKSFSDCEALFKKAIQYLEKSYIQDIVLEISSYYNLGHAFYYQDKLSNALRIFSTALEKSTEYRCFYDEGKIYMIMGVIHARLGEMDKAVRATRKAIDFFTYTEEVGLRAGALKNLGNIYLRSRQYEDALLYLEKALAYYDKENKLNLVHMIKGDIFEALVGKGDYEEAVLYAEGIYAEYLGAEDLCGFYKNLGKLYLCMKNLDKAKAYLEKARVGFEGLEDKSLLGEIHALSAECGLIK